MVLPLDAADGAAAAARALEDAGAKGALVELGVDARLLQAAHGDALG